MSAPPLARGISAADPSKYMPIKTCIDRVQNVCCLNPFPRPPQDYETEGREIMDRLYHLPAHGSLKLLYITPEKFAR